MFDKIGNWVATHVSFNTLRNVTLGISIVTPAVLGYTIFTAGEAYGEAKQAMRDEAAIQFANRAVKMCTDLTKEILSDT